MSCLFSWRIHEGSIPCRKGPPRRLEPYYRKVRDEILHARKLSQGKCLNPDLDNLDEYKKNAAEYR